jgi:hypothetical protein
MFTTIGSDSSAISALLLVAQQLFDYRDASEHGQPCRYLAGESAKE